MINRSDLAGRIADGVGGQLQLLSAQHMLEVCDESVVQITAASVAHSTRDFRVLASAKPNNWPDGDGKRLDIGLTASSAGASTWYGAVEVKYLSSTTTAQNARLPLLQDCARLASVETTNLNAKLLVAAFVDGMLDAVFTTPHPRAVDAEQQRVVLGQLLHLTLPDTSSPVGHDVLTAAFPSYQTRVPSSAAWTDRGLEAELLARRDFHALGQRVGTVCVWQVNKTVGRPSGT
jgi:hypothetical protein